VVGDGVLAQGEPRTDLTREDDGDRNTVATQPEEDRMADSVYRVTEVIGVSSDSWEAAARNAVETAAKTVRDLRIAEVVRQDVTIADGGVVNFRVRLAISFKYDSGD
jgi:dodecin